MRKRVYYRKFLNMWRHKFNHAVKKSYLEQLKTRFITEHVKRKLFRLWLGKMRKQCSIARRDQMIMNARHTETTSKVFYALKHHSEKKRRQRALRNAIDDNRRLAILRKCVNGWRGFIPETLNKQLLLEEVQKDYSNKIMKKVFDVLRLNLNYRVEKQCTDVLLTKSIHMIVAKRFFRQWRSLGGKRMGLELLAVTMKKL